MFERLERLCGVVAVFGGDGESEGDAAVGVDERDESAAHAVAHAYEGIHGPAHQGWGCAFGLAWFGLVFDGLGAAFGAQALGRAAHVVGGACNDASRG